MAPFCIVVWYLREEVKILKELGRDTPKFNFYSRCWRKCSMMLNHIIIYFRDEVKILKELGRGNFGVVSSGRWRDTDVAIKVVSWSWWWVWWWRWWGRWLPRRRWKLDKLVAHNCRSCLVWTRQATIQQRRHRGPAIRTRTSMKRREMWADIFSLLWNLHFTALCSFPAIGCSMNSTALHVNNFFCMISKYLYPKENQFAELHERDGHNEKAEPSQSCQDVRNLRWQDALLYHSGTLNEKCLNGNGKRGHFLFINFAKNMSFTVTGFLLLSFLSQENCSKGDLKKHLESFKQGTGELIRGGWRELLWYLTYIGFKVYFISICSKLKRVLFNENRCRLRRTCSGKKTEPTLNQLLQR